MHTLMSMAATESTFHLLFDHSGWAVASWPPCAGLERTPLNSADRLGGSHVLESRSSAPTAVRGAKQCETVRNRVRVVAWRTQRPTRLQMPCSHPEPALQALPIAWKGGSCPSERRLRSRGQTVPHRLQWHVRRRSRGVGCHAPSPRKRGCCSIGTARIQDLGMEPSWG